MDINDQKKMEEVLKGFETSLSIQHRFRCLDYAKSVPHDNVEDLIKNAKQIMVFVETGD